MRASPPLRFLVSAGAPDDVSRLYRAASPDDDNMASALRVDARQRPIVRGACSAVDGAAHFDSAPVDGAGRRAVFARGAHR